MIFAMIKDKDKSLLLALAVSFQRLWDQRIADTALKEEVDARLAALEPQIQAIFSAVQAFGVETRAGWFWPIREAVGPAVFDKAMLDAGIRMQWGDPPEGYAPIVLDEPKFLNTELLNADAPVREIVLERLKIAERRGAKASDIRSYIEMLRGKKLHDKTIGMTLYRLSMDGLARREGRIWYYVPPPGEGVNSGGGMPGLANRFTDDE